MVVILVAVAAGSVWRVNEHGSTTAALQENAEITFLLLDAQANSESAAGALQRYVIVGDDGRIPGNDDTLLPQIEANVAAATDDLTQAIALVSAQGDEAGAASLNAIIAGAATLVQESSRIVALRQAGAVEEATAAFEGTVPIFREFENKLNEMAEGERAEASALRAEADQTRTLAVWVLIISAGAGAVLGLAASALIVRSIIRPLSKVRNAALAVAGGDLQARSPEFGPDELAELGISINSMTDSLLDASKRRELEESLRESEALHRNLVETSQDLIWRCDDEGRFIFLNKAWETTHGYRLEEMLGRPFTDFMTREVADRDVEEFGRLMTAGSVTGYEATHISKTGSEIHLLFNAIPLLDGDGRQIGTQGTANDITERKRAEDMIKHMAYHDALTDLPNRTLFTDRLNVALANARRAGQMVAVLFLDLDRFKTVNDTVGHGASSAMATRFPAPEETSSRCCCRTSREGKTSLTLPQGSGRR